jgi:hypothetical protein
MNLRQAFEYIQNHKAQSKKSELIAFADHKNEECYVTAGHYQAKSDNDPIKSHFYINVYYPISESNYSFLGQTIEDAVRDAKPFFRNLHYSPLPESYIGTEFLYKEILLALYPDLEPFINQSFTIKDHSGFGAFLKNVVYPKNDQVKTCRPKPKQS